MSEIDIMKSEWHVVGQPWNPHHGYIIAGHHDPHCGVVVCDCDMNVAQEESETMTDEQALSLSYEVAQHIVSLHNANLEENRD